MVENQISQITKDAKGLTCLSFCSGALGLDLGLAKAGFTTLLTCEIDPQTRQTILANWPKVGLLDDLRKYDFEAIYHYAGLTQDDDLDLVIGGPPCQSFSTAGHRKGLEDPRGNVFLHYLNLALNLQPKFIVIENVRGLLSAPLQHIPHKNRSKHCLADKNTVAGSALLSIIQKIRQTGYSVSFNLYNAANFGTPQIRERLVIICARDGYKMPYLRPTHSDCQEYGLPAWKTLQSAIGDLVESKQTYINFPAKRLKYYRLIRAGENWKSLPLELQKEALGNSYAASGGKTGFLRRLAWHKPAPTLVTSPVMPATDLAHPEQDRPLSIEEYKRIQEFPDDWIVAGNILDQYRQIGNAVPISLGYAIGKLIKERLQILDQHLDLGDTSIDNIGLEKSVLDKSCLAKIDLKSFPYSRYKDTDDVSWERNVLQNLQFVQQKQISLLD